MSDSAVSANAPAFFHIKGVQVIDTDAKAKANAPPSKPLPDSNDVRYSAAPALAAAKEREKNRHQTLKTTLQDVISQKPMQPGDNRQDVLFPNGVSHVQALTIDPHGDGLKHIEPGTTIPGNVTSIRDIAGGRK